MNELTRQGKIIMTIFGIIWLIIVLCAFFKNNMRYMLFFTLLFMTFQCDHVIVIDKLGIGPQILTSVVFITKAVLSKGCVLRLRKGRTLLVMVSFLLFASIIVSCVYNGILADKILSIVPIFSYMFCFFAMMFFCNGITSEELYNILRWIIIFHLVMGIVQILTTIEILPLRPVLKVLFYNETDAAVYFQYSNYNRIMSTFMEPSYFSGILVGAFYYFLSIKEKWKENIILLAVTFIELILTKSSTAYGAFAIIGIVFILCQNRIKIQTKVLILIVATVAFAVVYFGFYNLLDAVIFSKSQSGSGIVRKNMNLHALRNFETSKWFGVGYGNIRGSSIIYSLLAETGIFGFTAYLFFNFVMFAPMIQKGRKVENKYNSDYIGIIFAVMGAFFCQIIACPDLDLCTYWFWIYVLGARRYIYVWQSE